MIAGLCIAASLALQDLDVLRARVSQGELPAVLAELERASPLTLEELRLRAQLQQSYGDAAGAAESWAAVLERVPGDLDARYRRGQSLWLEGRYAAARRELLAVRAQLGTAAPERLAADLDLLEELIAERDRLAGNLRALRRGFLGSVAVVGLAAALLMRTVLRRSHGTS